MNIAEFSWRVAFCREKNMKKLVVVILIVVMLVCMASCETQSPYIGENGNWWVGDQDLGVAAQGPAGKDAEADAVPATEIAKTLMNSAVVIHDVDENGHYLRWTGFVASPNGYIVTSYGLVADGLGRLEVIFHNGQELIGELVSANEADYIAIIKVDAVLPVAPMGDSDAVLPGETVYCVGATEKLLTFTQGLMSATDCTYTHSGREYAHETRTLLTDASNVNANCGCLANQEGKVIGLSLAVGEMHYVVPINAIVKLVDAVEKNGRCDDIETGNTRRRPLLGFSAKTVKIGDANSMRSPATSDGVLVVSVNVGGFSEGMLQVDDIICEIDGTTVVSIEQLQAKMYEYRLGDRIHLKIDRLGELLEVDVDLLFKQ